MAITDTPRLVHNQRAGYHWAMTQTEVKICGIRDRHMLDVALEAGADYVGLVFFPKSPRHITLAAAAALARAMAGRARSVALTVDADDAALREIMQTVAPDMLQLHGHESPARVAEIRERFAVPVIKAFRIANATDVTRALAWRGLCDLILFDAAAPTAASSQNELPGGNGIAFDWRALDQLPGDLPYMLSGGLTPNNVAEAIARTGAQAVDVSSGVERQRGIKDAALIRRFIANAKMRPRCHKP